VEEIIENPIEIEAVDISDKHIEKMARGFIMGSHAVGQKKEVRELLEKKVTTRIGKKGKWLVDKLFELIEGVYVIDKRGGKNGEGIRYYQVPPSLNAIIYALDRVLGKPKTTVETNEEKRGLVLVEHVIKNLAGNPYRNGGETRENIIAGVGRESTGGEAGTESGDVESSDEGVD
jgi:hypothetical protein